MDLNFKLNIFHKHGFPIFRAIILIYFLFSLTQFLSAQTKKYAPGEIIVRVKASDSVTNLSMTSNLKLGVISLDKLSKSFGLRKVQTLINKASPTNMKLPGEKLKRIFKLTFPEEIHLEDIIAAFQQDDNVEYVQPNYIHQLHFVPNDSLFTEQSALHQIQAEQAWDIQLAWSEIIVGVIDTGIDYHHEDLRNSLWLNSSEDLNGNSQVDSSDFNGLDDDGNGFVDDLRGWDFTDAPGFPDGGDYQTPDNDPFDENGHGTSVAGIIGAAGNNRKGIAGLAFGCQIMNLRAGTSRGLLEEDDVASAIVYAVENGARIINMSFGDEVASPLLQDVIQFAYSQNCILVASAGNSSTDRIHFPSGFAETISVGAVNENDVLAGFSNYGTSVDLVAPGVRILTTQMGHKYGIFSGTSASAPFVSALAALILSKTPELSNETVKGLLTSTTDDLGTMGWDNLYAAGRINAFKTLNSPFYSVVRILEPKLDAGFASGPIVIRGTAVGALLKEFILEFGIGETPDEWTEIFRLENRQILDEPIMELDVAACQDTVYTLRLIAQNRDGTSIEDKVRFFIDRTPPEITKVTQTPIIDGNRHSILIEFETDDLCDAVIHFRAKDSNENFQEKRLAFRTRTHRVNFTQDLFTGQLEFFIEAINGAGLTSKNDNEGKLFAADLGALPIGGAAVEKLAVTLPSGLVLEKTSDFDDDGKREFILNQYQDNFSFGPLKIFEFNQNQFEEVYSSRDIFIPRDWGDSDGDGLPELLTGAGASSFIFEAPADNKFPSKLVWAESNDVWASRFADLDRDGKGEIILRLDELFTVWESIGDNEYVLADSFPNPTNGTNFVGVPHSEIGDFDGDEQLEILMGDGDGDVYIYENRGNDRYEFTWSDRLPLIDTIDFLSVGDYDGDSVTDFVVGCHTDPGLKTESTFDSQHWLYRIYTHNGDNSFNVAWEQAFFGFQSPVDFDSGVSAGDVDDDGRAEILINVFPDFYLVDYDPHLSEYQVIWYASPNRSNRTIVEDFDNNGLNEFYFNSGKAIEGYQLLTEFNGPPTPSGFSARPLDTNLVELSWQASELADGFQIYRGTNPQNLLPLIHTQNSPHLDTTVVRDVEYWYMITSLDSTRSPTESLPSPTVKIQPGAKPFLQSATQISPNQVKLSFSEPMNQSVKNHTNFNIEGVGIPTSSIIDRSGKDVILSSPVNFVPGEYRVTARNVADLAGTPIDTSRNSATFQTTIQEKAPYLVSANLEGVNTLRLEFSESMDAASVKNVENYVIKPFSKIVEARINAQDARIVFLQTDSNSPIGPYGIEYVIIVKNVKSQNGLAVKRGLGDSIVLIFSNPDLSHIFAYPNPFRSDSHQEYVTIAGLTRKATVKILNVSGRLIRTLEETDGNGGVQWDLKDESENLVPSGIYLFYVVGEGQKAMGKFAILR